MDIYKEDIWIYSILDISDEMGMKEEDFPVELNYEILSQINRILRIYNNN